ncbi:MAG: TlpA family protein disulfide reductase [Bacteriovoracaceae bacterium]|nr:TlpA family protein disulfide reductase [Bacteriovoracaceae bacterium]
MNIKRFLPVFFFILTLMAYLTGQVAFENGQTNARNTEDDKKISAHYESMFKQSSFKTMDGKTVKLSDVKAPVVILNFWASWCKPCLAEFGSIEKMKKKFTDDQVLFLGINTDSEEQIKSIKKTVKKFSLTFPIVADKESKVVDDYKIEAIPVSIIFANGKVIEVSNKQKDFDSGEAIELFKKYL